MTEEERAAALRAMVREINGGARPEPQADAGETTPQAPPRSAENTQPGHRAPQGVRPELYNAYLQTIHGITPNWF